MSTLTLRASFDRILRNTGKTIKQFYGETKDKDPVFSQTVEQVLKTDAGYPVDRLRSEVKSALVRIVNSAVSESGVDFRTEFKTYETEHFGRFSAERLGTSEFYDRCSNAQLMDKYITFVAHAFRQLIWELETPNLPVPLEALDGVLQRKGVPTATEVLTYLISTIDDSDILSDVASEKRPPLYRDFDKMIPSDPIFREVAGEWAKPLSYPMVDLKPASVRILWLVLEKSGLGLKALLREALASFYTNVPEADLQVLDRTSDDRIIQAYAIEMEKRFYGYYNALVTEKTSQKKVASNASSVQGGLVSAIAEFAIAAVVSNSSDTPQEVHQQIIDVQTQINQLKRRRQETEQEFALKQEQARNNRWFRKQFEADHPTLMGILGSPRTAKDYRSQLSSIDTEIINLEGFLQKLRVLDVRDTYEELGVSPAARLTKDELADIKSKADTIESIRPKPVPAADPPPLRKTRAEQKARIEGRIGRLKDDKEKARKDILQGRTRDHIMEEEKDELMRSDNMYDDAIEKARNELKKYI